MRATDAGTAGQEYLTDHLTLHDFYEDMSLGESPTGIGDHLPDFDLPLVGGGRLSRADVLGKPLLLVFGAYSCPMTVAAVPLLHRLQARCGGRVRIVLLYVREPHPGEHVGQPRTMIEKRAHAARLKQEYDLPFEVAVDEIDGGLHRRFDVKPNSVYLTDAEGQVVFRALWASDSEVERAVAAVAEGKTPPVAESERRLGPVLDGIGVMRGVFRAVGPRAEADLWRVAPPMAMAERIAAPFRFLPPRWRLPAALGVGAIAALLLAGLARRRH